MESVRIRHLFVFEVLNTNTISRLAMYEHVDSDHGPHCFHLFMPNTFLLSMSKFPFQQIGLVRTYWILILFSCHLFSTYVVIKHDVITIRKIKPVKGDTEYKFPAKSTDMLLCMYYVDLSYYVDLVLQFVLNSSSNKRQCDMKVQKTGRQRGRGKGER